MRVFIPEDIVVDDDLPTPQPGVVLPLMAVRLQDGLDRGDHTTIDGTITWARYDTLSGLVEAVISTREVDVFTQSFGQESDLAIVDSITSQTGLLWCIRPYEFDAFDLPDIRRPWVVHSVVRSHSLAVRRDRRGWLVDASPVADGGPTSS
jgi:hypothetical protein